MRRTLRKKGRRNRLLSRQNERRNALRFARQRSVASLQDVEFRRFQTAAIAPNTWSAEFFSNLTRSPAAPTAT